MVLFRDLINIGYFNNNIFKPELIIQMKDKKYLNYIISQIRQSHLQGFTNSLIFDNNNIGFYQSNFTVYKLSYENKDPILGYHNDMDNSSNHLTKKNIGSK